MNKKTTTRIIAAAAGTLLLAAANAQQMPGAGKTLRPIEATLLEEKFQAQIVYRALKELGYQIAEPNEIEYQSAHLVVGSGDADFFTSHWSPLHQVFLDESGGSEHLEVLGTLINGALQGYMVDMGSYEAGITSLGDLSDPAVAARFDADGDGKADLAGCVPGWGCERVIEHHLEEFGLRDTVNHNQGSYNAIIGDTISRHKQGEPVLYYTWTPYWVSGVLVPGVDVQWLDVPYTSLPDGRTANTEHEGRNLGFEINSINIVANRQFLAQNPAARKLFEMIKVGLNSISAQNNLINQGENSDEDIARHVDDWIRQNQQTFDNWIAEARKAG